MSHLVRCCGPRCWWFIRWLSSVYESGLNKCHCAVLVGSAVQLHGTGELCQLDLLRDHLCAVQLHSIWEFCQLDLLSDHLFSYLSLVLKLSLASLAGEIKWSGQCFVCTGTDLWWGGKAESVLDCSPCSHWSMWRIGLHYMTQSASFFFRSQILKHPRIKFHFLLEEHLKSPENHSE